jgi:hypothetical protein
MTIGILLGFALGPMARGAGIHFGSATSGRCDAFLQDFAIPEFPIFSVA